jgi:pyrimidine operon attenuation protein/uracil phosphoribosyltransferase
MEIGREIRDVMSGEKLDSALTDIAKQINKGIPFGKLLLVGIRRRGAPLAERLAAKLRALKRDSSVGIMDITLYRDDLSEIGPVPMIGKTEIPFKITGSPVVLVDDVLFTGRTIRAAMDCLNDFGRPKLIHLAALVDRGGRELPIAANYVGMKISIEDGQTVQVQVQELDGEDRVVLLEVDSAGEEGRE